MVRTAGCMTSSLRPVNPLGLADAQRRAVDIQDRKLRIVAHNGANIYGGAERALINLLRGLQERGHQVTLCCNYDVVADAAVKRLVPAVIVPLRGDLVLVDATRFADVLKRERPDAVLLGTFKKIWLGGWAAARAGIEHTVVRVGLASDTPRRLKYRVALRKYIHTVVLNAESMRANFLAPVPDYDRSRVITIYNGVIPPQPRHEPGALRRELGIPEGVQVIGAIARLAGQKRLERLVELTARLSGVHCIIAGDGTARAALEAEIERLNVTDRVHLIGQRDDVGDVLSALDLYIVTSDQEGMSNAMLEALWCGVPVLSTPVSGAAEALEPMSGGQAPGAVTTDFSVEQLHHKALALLQDRSELRRMSVAAETRARDRFDFERMVSEWESVLRR